MAYPSNLCSVQRSWGENRARVLELAERIGLSTEQFNLDFFCGTMFWVRPSSLGPLRSLSISQQFEPENSGLMGGLEHAMERLFSAAVQVSGQKVLRIVCERLEFSDTPI